MVKNEQVSWRPVPIFLLLHFIENSKHYNRIVILMKQTKKEGGMLTFKICRVMSKYRFFTRNIVILIRIRKKRWQFLESE